MGINGNQNSTQLGSCESETAHTKGRGRAGYTADTGLTLLNSAVHVHSTNTREPVIFKVKSLPYL